MNERKAVSRETRRRYRRASRLTKTKILDEFIHTTKLNRKYAIQLLKGTLAVRRPTVSTGAPRGRPAIYDQHLLRVLIRLWALFGFMCGKRLVPAIRVNLAVLEKFQELRGLKGETRQALLRISASTVDRLLASERKKLQLKGRSHTRPGSLRRTLIPIRTFDGEDQREPGYVEVDLVGHDGGSTRGEYAQTLTLTDVNTGWTELQAVQNKAQKWVFPALKLLASLLPFVLRGINADNGGEFININVAMWCRLNKTAFTRSRPYRKNDNPYVEQKNNAVVRTAVGYLRYDTQEQLRLLNQLYAQLRLLVNFFYPSMKLIEKVRVGARVYKRYDTPRTPYQRVLDSADIPRAQKNRLHAQFLQLNPAAITRSVAALQAQLERKAAHRQPWPDQHRRAVMAATG
jgi:hypothetical protein